MSKDNKDPKLVGQPNEVKITINDNSTTALLDTGSSISRSFMEKHLPDITLKKIDQLLNIECADGSQLPYLGYIEVSIKIAAGLPDSQPKDCLLLVIPDSPYSERTLVILGTNILHEFMNDCKANFGSNFLELPGLQTPWYLCFHSIVIRDRELERNKNRIAVIRSAE